MTDLKAGCAVAAQEHGLLPLNQMSLEFYNRVDYSATGRPSLAWQAMLRLADRIAPDYEN